MNKKETDTKIFFAVCVCASSVVFNSLQPHVVGGPGSSVHGIFQERILERVAIFCFRESLQPRDRTRVSWNSCVAGSYFTAEPLAKPSLQYYSKKIRSNLNEHCCRRINILGTSMGGNHCIILLLVPASLAHPLFCVFLICLRMCYISYSETSQTERSPCPAITPFHYAPFKQISKRIVHVYCFRFLYSTSSISTLAPVTLSQDCHIQWSALKLRLA